MANEVELGEDDPSQAVKAAGAQLRDLMQRLAQVDLGKVRVQVDGEDGEGAAQALVDCLQFLQADGWALEQAVEDTYSLDLLDHLVNTDSNVDLDFPTPIIESAKSVDARAPLRLLVAHAAAYYSLEATDEGGAPGQAAEE